VVGANDAEFEKLNAPRTTRLEHPAHREPNEFDCLTPDQAFAYLTGSNVGPAAADVQAHLDRCEGCRVILGEAVRALSQSGGARRDSQRSTPVPLTLAVGDVIANRYEVLRFIACGGMGEVYEVNDTSLNEVVALKTLVLTSLNDEDAVARLRREVRLARKVTHPNVCRILEFGEYHPFKHPEETVPFLTMEFLHGETLAERLARQKRLPSNDVARFLAQMLAGLGAVHAAGIVHRDIKPQNVFILPGPPERIVVMDFGLARTLSTTASAITGSRVVGTADYMAPEQVRGRPPHRSFDIYAIGIVVFEMLTGQKPFPSGTPALAIRDPLRKSPPRPSAVLPSLDPSWDKLVARCLAFEPDQRFSRVEDVMLVLREQILRMRRTSRRPYGRWATDAFAVLGLGTGLGFGLHRVTLPRAHSGDAHRASVVQVARPSAEQPVLAQPAPAAEGGLPNPASSAAGGVVPPTEMK
jgi:hypothetical protein